MSSRLDGDPGEMRDSSQSQFQNLPQRRRARRVGWFFFGFFSASSASRRGKGVLKRALASHRAVRGNRPCACAHHMKMKLPRSPQTLEPFSLCTLCGYLHRRGPALDERAHAGGIGSGDAIVGCVGGSLARCLPSCGRGESDAIFGPWDSIGSELASDLGGDEFSRCGRYPLSGGFLSFRDVARRFHSGCSRSVDDID